MLWAWTVQDKRTGKIIAKGVSAGPEGAKRAALSAGKPNSVLVAMMANAEPPREYDPEGRDTAVKMYRRVNDANGYGDWVASGA